MSLKKSSQLKNVRKIALIGFSGPNQAMLEYCFSSEVDCELVTASAAQILVVNGDQGEGDEQLSRNIIEKYPAEFRLVISIRDVSWDGFALLKKPHTAQDLLSVVRSFSVTFSDSENQDTQPVKKEINSDDLDFYRSRDYARKRQGEALKQKLIKGNLVVSASDRLVQQIEADIREQEEQLKRELEAEKAKHEALLAKKKAKKLMLLKKKKLEEEKRLQEAKKKKLAAEKAKKLKQKLLDNKKKKELLAKREQEAEKALQDKSVKASQELTKEQILQCCGNAADADLTRPDERRSIFFNPEGSLLVKMTEAVDLALKLDQPVEITGLPGQMLVFPDQRLFYMTFSDEFLNQLALTRFGYGELEIEPKGDFQLEDKTKHLAERIESLIWKVALWTSRGRLLNGMDPEKLMQLTVQPDFESFQAIPDCYEISEVWSGQPMTALDIVRILDVPQRVVFAFMCGAYSLGWFQE
ncbi:hypothetical protein ACMXYX_08005 [Neptuniibacter sp. QD72_48]|uniref:hypothetical protein n=1 Tax=unclassified Neptuniibacter TaxID=2630693 RepID=UPI0039F6DC6B